MTRSPNLLIWATLVCNGCICAVCGVGWLRVKHLPQIGVDALFAVCRYFFHLFIFKKMQTQNFVLSLEKVKDCIGFQPGSGLHTSLSGMCDCWFGIEKSKGSTDEDAAKVVLDNLGKVILEMGDRSGSK